MKIIAIKVYQVDLPLREGRYNWSGGNFMEVFDSTVVDADGNIVVATLVTGALTVSSPGGDVLDQVMVGDPMTTNVCWGGPDLRTAYVTLSGTGRLISIPWPRPGLKLNY